MVTIRISLSPEDLKAAAKDIDRAEDNKTLSAEADRIADTLGECVEIDDALLHTATND